MTANHLLLYRLAELMLIEQSHQLLLDHLFDDEQIGEYVKSIQIDSPYQQMLLEGVLTETFKEDKMYVTFTVEGYFHFVLGEVIFNQATGKGAEFLKDIIENNKLNGVHEGIEQCLIRDAEQVDLSRLMWLIDQGGEALEACSFPLANAFLQLKGHPKTNEELERAQQIQIRHVMDLLLAESTENDISVLEKAVSHLEKTQKNSVLPYVYQQINFSVQPDNLKKGALYVRSIQYVPKKDRKSKLSELILKEFEPENELLGAFYNSLAIQFDYIAEYEKAIEYYNKALAIDLKVYGELHSSTATTNNNLGSIWSDKGEYDKATFKVPSM